MFINDLIPGVIRKLRGRSDVSADIPFYVKEALIDITQNYEFEELRINGPITNFIQNQSEYPKTASGCPFIWPTDVKLTFVVTWYCYFNNTISTTPGATLGLEMKGRSPRVVEPMSKIPGQPVMYAIIGPTLIVGFMPNTNYATQMRYQRQHPFNPDAALGATQVFLPDDWQGILEYAAAEKACDNLGMTEIGTLYHQKLYGAPGNGRTAPQMGLIMERMSQQSRNTAFNEKQLKPVVRLVG